MDDDERIRIVAPVGSVHTMTVFDPVTHEPTTRRYLITGVTDDLRIETIPDPENEA
jgi:hypothetical protein